ncbi:MAG TPA: FliM/FliN family flagellar motor switch protein [Ramlibacter sp.]|nr:FliM/FliN family flagellar motor switch protein [Ramlibacter sp.]
MSLEDFELRSGRPSVQPIGLSELDHPNVPSADGSKVMRDTNPLHAVRATLTASVGMVQISVGELLAAKEGHVLVLDRAIDDPIDLMLEGRLVARAQLVAMDGNFAIRITELPVPLTA